MFQQTVKHNNPLVPLMASGRNSTPSHLGSHCNLHYHDEMEFLIVYEGEFVAIIDNKEYVARAGEVIFINSGVPHTTRCDKENTYTGILQFRLKDFTESEIERIIRYSVKYRSFIGESVRVLSSQEFYHCVEEVIDEALLKKGAYEMFVKSGIFRILGHLYRFGYLADGLELYQRKEIQKILPALTYINEHFSEDITLEDVSAHLGFNPSYFCRIFKSAIGATFTEYLNFVRVCKAERILATTQDSILEIAGSVGICSVSYFNRIFKKYHNCSPSVYRQAQYTKAPI